MGTDWRAGWTALAGIGVTGLCVAERHGGVGRRVDAAVAAAQELGAALHGSPFAGVVASAHALAAGADAIPAAADLLPLVLAGDAVCAFGRLGPDGRTARAVDGAPDADALVVVDPARGRLVLLADRSSWHATASPHRFDLTRTCADVAVHDVGAGAGLGDAADADRLHRLLLAADAAGCVRRMLDRTVAYAGQRHTFGKPIGATQAVQHRLVDHTVRARGMSLVVAEAARLLAARAPDASRFVAMAEVGVSSGALHILHDLLQLTGAIGFTWEYGLHLYERRVHQDARLAANPRAASLALAEIEGWRDAG
ncbi:MAG TPA: acyl-CoA dehydrogenase [Acidimicrobiales bacterium]|nr:acyl-CoA dehydrogenase [Acidimicrobiales bacterium]